MNDNRGLKLVAPKVTPVLDPAFRPAVLANAAYRKAVKSSRQGAPVVIALEQADGSVFHFNTAIFPEGHAEAKQNAAYLERFVKFLLWSRGGFRVYFAGPRAFGEELQRYYAETRTGRFDAEIMGERVYERPFEVLITEKGQIPLPREVTKPLGRHLKGCRIGFDLGASDYKIAAVVDGKVVFSEELHWQPSAQNDPQYHFDHIMTGLKHAAAKLPHVDGIGGSAAGVYVNNRVKVASLFRGIPKDLFDSRVKDLFLEMKKAWNDIPFEVVNDGEVTALAGSMSMKDNAVLGTALGSSQAGGYVTPNGNITSWLNELAFCPVDYSPNAPVDEWSKDRGCGAQFFSQQAVGRLVGMAGIELDAAMPLPEKLKHVQALMAKGCYRAAKIYETIGVYLGYAIAHYAEFYKIKNVLVLGRVTTGEGGSVIIHNAKRVLKEEFPALLKKIRLRTPSERDKRHGQAIAAASLPWAAAKS